MKYLPKDIAFIATKEIQIAANSKHHTLGGSTSHRWIMCTASVREIKRAIDMGKIKPFTGNTSTHLGTVAHKLGEMALRLGFEPEYLIEQSIAGVDIDYDMVDAVTVYTDHIKKIIKKSWDDPVLKLEYGGTLYEHKDFGCGGEADSVIIDDSDLHINDYKHGAGVAVYAENNTQMSLYALTVLKKMDAKLIKNIHMSIIQPRCSKDTPIDTWTIKKEELLKWENEVLKPAFDNIVFNETVFFPSAETCKFCPISGGICDGERERVTSDFEEIESSNLDSTNDLYSILEKEDFIIGFFKRAREQVKNRIIGGGKFEGYKIIQGLGHRKFCIPNLELEKKFSKYKVSIYENTLKSPEALEKEVKSKLTKDKLTELFNNVTERPKTEYQLVKESAKGQAINFNPAEDFKNE